MNSSLQDLETFGLSVVIGSYNRKKIPQENHRNTPERTGISSLSLGNNYCRWGTDGTLSWLIEQKDIISIIQHNRGEWMGKPIERRSWGYFMNLGFKSAKGKYICMISDNCLVVPGAILNGYNLF